jgi:hypothetical protein
MPWHVIVFHTKQRPEDPWLREDRVFRSEDYPGEDALLRAVGDARWELQARYPAPEFQVVWGSGPESTSPDFYTFVGWLLREE